MKKVFNKIGIAFKQFFSSLWEDFVHLLKERKFKLLGFIIMFVVPIVVLIVEYIQKTPAKEGGWTLPVFVFIPLAVLLLVYWGKAKRFFHHKLENMKTENAIQKGKHAGAIIVLTVIQMLATILPFALCYLLFNRLEKVIESLADIFLFITICESVGGLFIIIDAVKNCVDYTELEEKGQEK